ncbi:MAG TPA: SDR family oxidoreductase [Acidimicrobiales bacterium]|nr:SDR family oxidoreductase [Acidimicrobiales bacterium]
MTGWGPFDLTGKRAIVTGGAMGIGRGIVRRFAQAGADVLVADLDYEAAQMAAKEFEDMPGRVAATHADVSDLDIGEELVARCVGLFDGVDILVNNAGIYPMVPMLEMTPELFDTVYRVNLRGLAFISQAVARQMVKQGSGGKIVNIASIDSVHPSMVGLAAYDASKGGVLMFTRNLALELAPHGIAVNAIAPGGISTEGTAEPLEGSGMTPEQMEEMLQAFTAKIPLGRMGQPDDIATVAVFLASAASDYVTGELVVVDGGKLLT